MGCTLKTQRPEQYGTEPQNSESAARKDNLRPGRRSQVSHNEMPFPMYVMTMECFMKLECMEPHLEMKEKGSVVEWTPDLGRVNLLSHQWLGWSHPDPEAAQLTCMQKVFQLILDGHSPFRSEQDWERYSTSRTYKGSAATEFQVEATEQLFTRDMFLRSVRDGYVWLDYAGIPQVGVREEAHKTKEEFKELQQAAVDSIPAYVEVTTNLWVMCPPSMHVDLKTECNFVTWRSRGWCRVEDWCNEFSLAARRPLIVEGPSTVWVEDLADKLTSRAQRPRSALNGTFTCCQLDHRTADGATFPCDKPRVRHVLRTALEGKLNFLKQTGDVIYHAWFMCLKPALLAEDSDDTMRHQQSSEEALAEFLMRYGWKSDVEGRDVPEQYLFFPLLCAATEGNLGAVRALIEARCNVTRRLLDAGTSSLEAAAVSGHVQICELLLAHGAPLTGASVFDGRQPIHKACAGGASEVLKLMLERRACIEARTNDKKTPLAIAAEEGHFDCVKLLLQAEANTTADDADGCTTMQLANNAKHYYIASILASDDNMRVWSL